MIRRRITPEDLARAAAALLNRTPPVLSLTVGQRDHILRRARGR